MVSAVCRSRTFGATASTCTPEEAKSDDDPFDRNVKIVAFNDAPFYLRAKAIDKLPDWLEALIATVDATAERVQKKIQPAKELADAIGALVKK